MEESIFKDDNITITKTKIICGEKTYNKGAICSVEIGGDSSGGNPYIFHFIIVFVIAVILFFVFKPDFLFLFLPLFTNPLFIAGLLLILILIVIAVLKLATANYRLIIVTRQDLRREELLSHKDKNYIAMLCDILNDFVEDRL